jgi:hypothetical protein
VRDRATIRLLASRIAADLVLVFAAWAVRARRGGRRLIPVS